MKLSDTAIEKIKYNTRVKARLMLALDRGSGMVEKWIKYNNSPMLTTAVAIKIIKEETGLTEDEILVDEPVKV